MNQELSCNGCEFLKCIAVQQQIYYCDNEDRVNDMGKLGTDRLPDRIPAWCPRRK